MTNQKDQYTLDRVIRMALSAAVLVAVFLLLRLLSDVLLPFAAAVILAYLLNPLVTAMEAKTSRRGVAVAFTMGGLGIAGLVAMLVVAPLMVAQVARFGDNLQKLRSDLSTDMPAKSPTAAPLTTNSKPSDAATGISATGGSAVGGAAASGSGLGERTSLGWRELKTGWDLYRTDTGTLSRAERLGKLRAAIADTYAGMLVERAINYTNTDEFNELLVDAAKHVLVGGWTVLTLAVNFVLALTGLIVVMLYLVFLLLDYPEYARTWRTFLPPSYRTTIVEFLDQFDIAMRRYFRGQSVVAIAVGVLFAIGFSIIGLPMAVPFGLFIGLLNMVPYLQMVGLVPAMLLACLRTLEGDAGLVGSVLLVLLVFAVVQLIQDALLTPRIMGKATGLRPVAILLGVFIWGKLLGFLGLLVAIPLTCLGIAYYRRFVLHQAASAVAIQPDP